MTPRQLIRILRHKRTSSDLLDRSELLAGMPAPRRDNLFVDQAPVDRDLRRLVHTLTISPVRTAIYPAPQGSVIKASRIKFAGLLLDRGEERFSKHNLTVDQIGVALLAPAFEIGGALVIATPG